MITELHQADFPQIYLDLVVHFPDKPWLKRVASLQYQVKANPMSKDWVRQGNVIAYGLAEFDVRGVEPVDVQAWTSVKHAMAFAAQVLTILKAETPDGARKLIGRIHGALRKPETMRGILFELNTATQLYRMGCSIEWMEEDRGDDTFDMLVDVPGIGPVEFECKTFSSDTGEAIPYDLALELINRLMPQVEKTLPFLPQHMFAISLVMEATIPTKVSGQAQLASDISDAIARTDPALDGVCSISLQVADLSTLPCDPDEATLNSLSDHLLGNQPAHQVIKRLSELSFLAIRVWSVVPSTLEKKMKVKAKTAIRDQMSGTRPGCLVMRIERHSGDGLKAVAEDAENHLAEMATNLLKNPEHAHLASVVFVSSPTLTQLSETTESSQSCSYAFDNLVGSYPNLGFGRLFAAR